MQELYYKWWGSNRLNCELYEDKSELTNELSFHKVLGVFVVVGLVLILSFLILFVEFFWTACKTSENNADFVIKVRYAIKHILRHFFNKKFYNVFEKANKNKLLKKQNANKKYLGKNSCLIVDGNNLFRQKFK